MYSDSKIEERVLVPLGRQNRNDNNDNGNVTRALGGHCGSYILEKKKETGLLDISFSVIFLTHIWAIKLVRLCL